MEYTGIIALFMLTILDKANAAEEDQFYCKEEESYWPSGKEIIRDAIKDCVIASALGCIVLFWVCCIKPCIVHTLAYYCIDANVEDDDSVLLGEVEQQKGKGDDIYEQLL